MNVQTKKSEIGRGGDLNSNSFVCFSKQQKHTEIGLGCDRNSNSNKRKNEIGLGCDLNSNFILLKNNTRRNRAWM